MRVAKSHALTIYLGGGRRRVEEVHTRVVAMLDQEGRGSSGFRDVIIGGKPGHALERGAVFLLPGDVGAQGLFHDSIGSLGLALRLMVEGRRQAGGYA